MITDDNVAIEHTGSSLSLIKLHEAISSRLASVVVLNHSAITDVAKILHNIVQLVGMNMGRNLRNIQLLKVGILSGLTINISIDITMVERTEIS